MTRLFASLAILAGLLSQGLALSLIRNGDFENGTNVVWEEHSDSDYAIIDDWNDFTGTGRGAWLGGYSLDDATATDWIAQRFDATGFGDGLLTYDLTISPRSLPGLDFLTVRVESSLTGESVIVKTVDLGSDASQSGLTVDLTSLGRYDTLVFRLDLAPFAQGGNGSSAWIDNVTLEAQPVPDPAAFATLGLGALILRRRRSPKA